MTDKKIYDLEERTAKFAEEIIVFAQKIEKNCVTAPLISQLIRAGTSIGANYVEATGGESEKDFVHKIAIGKKEAKETGYWLRAIAQAVPKQIDECRKLWKESRELTLIFSRIIISCHKKKEK